MRLLSVFFGSAGSNPAGVDSFFLDFFLSVFCSFGFNGFFFSLE